MNVIADLPVGAGRRRCRSARRRERSRCRPVVTVVTLAIRLEDMTLAGPTTEVPGDALALDGVVDKVTLRRARGVLIACGWTRARRSRRTSIDRNGTLL